MWPPHYCRFAPARRQPLNYTRTAYPWHRTNSQPRPFMLSVGRRVCGAIKPAWATRSPHQMRCSRTLWIPGRFETNEYWAAHVIGVNGREVFAVWFSNVPNEEQLASVQQFAASLAAAVAVVRPRELQQKRLRRLEAILEIAAQWNQTNEMVTLLHQMAETSTRLLGAERASIFLWDKPNKLLVGAARAGRRRGRTTDPRRPRNRGTGWSSPAKPGELTWRSNKSSAKLTRTTDKKL